MLALISYLRARLPVPTADDQGQASAEYALVLLGAAGVAVAVATWANDKHVITNLLDKVMNSLLNRVPK